ncbi:Acyl-protein thioesterase 1 [Elsinoe australis]|uniref:Acyl-protein thioesterase 1 n=1 Tax=Elsinoe australis TaxID=40998 RepID=A0A2P7YDB7_9PEZI|nr:Acyl-protein thioesterase 1 [Elsinoe australis]
MSSTEATHEVASLSAHTHTIIFLHGRDSSAVEFASEIFESQASNDLTLPQLLPGIKWIFPSAPGIPSKRFDCDMSQWFDMRDVQSPDEQWQDQVADLRASVQRILGTIKHESDLIGGPQNVLVAGISQGAATAAHAVLQINCAGFVGLNTWFALGDEAERVIEMARENIDGRRKAVGELLGVSEVVARRESCPVFLAHCEDDEVVPSSNGERMKAIFEQLGAEVEWRQYADGGHWLNEPQGVDDLMAFVKKALRITA